MIHVRSIAYLHERPYASYLSDIAFAPACTEPNFQDIPKHTLNSSHVLQDQASKMPVVISLWGLYFLSVFGILHGVGFLCLRLDRSEVWAGQDAHLGWIEM